MPDDNDDPRNITWDNKHVPKSLRKFIGKENAIAVDALEGLVTTRTMRNLIVQGPPGSGKTAMTEVFIKAFLAEIQLERIRNPDAASKKKTFGRKFKKKRRDPLSLPEPVLRLEDTDCAHMAAFDKRISEWVEQMNKFDEIEERIVILERLSNLSPNQQQWLCRLMERLEMTGEPPRPVYFIFTCLDYNRIIGKLKIATKLLELTTLSEIDALGVFLSVAVKERIGFEREAMEIIYKRVGPHIGHVLNMLQQVFVKHQFVSFINAMKETATEIIDAWKKSKMKFFEFKLLGDARAFTSPWSGEIPRVRVMNSAGIVTQDPYLVNLGKTGYVLETAHRQLSIMEEELRTNFHRESVALGLVTENTAADESEDPKKTKKHLRDSKTMPTRRINQSPNRNHRKSRKGKGEPAEESKEEISPEKRRKLELAKKVADLRRSMEMVDDPWLTIRHVSDRFDTRRVDFVVKRANHTEWIFVEFINLNSLLYDATARCSALGMVLLERPVMRLEPIIEKKNIRKLPSDARCRNPKHDGRFIPATRLETLDLSRPQHHFQIEGYSRSGMPHNPKDPKSFNGTRTRWYQLKLHQYFEGRQCWRIQVKGDPTWIGFGNASREGFN